MVVRWLAAAVVTIGLSVAALGLSVCLAVEPHPTMTTPSTGLFHDDAVEPELPIGVESGSHDPSALPRFTQ